ncbi:hypothetical protein HED60_18550 [Planctomycetales bacterium ZRK34]|nr:hypothetical protein HED60_18550 [Planctomycetales bacterium ZRK34]
MRIGRWLNIGCVPVGLFVLALAVMSPAAQAQRQRLADAIVSNPGPLPSQATDAIETYVKTWAGQLLTAESDKQIIEARQQLLEPVQRQAPVQTTDVVRDAVARATAAMLKPAVKNSSDLARMNTMIVLAQMPTGDSAPTLATGLADKNRGIRYWAAKAVAEVSKFAQPGQSPFSNAQQQSLLDALNKVMPTETSAMVLEQMYRALGSLTIPAAQKSLLDILDQRIKLHVKQVSPGLRADAKGINNLYSRLIVQQAVGNNVNPALRQLTAVSGKYLLVVAKGLQADKVEQDLVPVCMELIQVVDDIFSNMLKQFDPNHMPGPSLVAAARSSQFPVLLLNTLDWVGDSSQNKPGILSTSQISIPMEDLTLPK